MPPIPDRSEPLRLPPADHGWKQTLLTVLGVLMFGAMLAAAAVYTAPTLASDWRVRDAARPTADSRVTDGECRARIVLQICDMTLNLRTASGTVSRRVNYVFTGVGSGGYDVQVLADPAMPERATTDLGLDKLWNRTITLAAIAAVLLAFTILPIIAMVRGRRASSTTP